MDEKLWDIIDNEYCRECLDSDGDFTKDFIVWLKENYHAPTKIQ